jgi:NTE family protein
MLLGIPKFFIPGWFNWNFFNSNTSQIQEYTQPPWKWTYMYDNTLLKETINKYIDFKKLSPKARQTNTIDSNSNNNTRLIITAVDVLSAEPLVLDSYKTQIEMKHLLATIGYPQYGFPWVEVKEGTYGWDGSLLSNTPIREVMAASPSNNKNIFVVENYPRKIDKLPANRYHHFVATNTWLGENLSFSDSENKPGFDYSYFVFFCIQLANAFPMASG